ncbi:hypothetical protein SISSUDRAFT_644991 [Sistotremastrum suecicum HHB10207 ss-3]|uniref:Uncharacterized protein n=1 Tax=Sistotremastrum suecicum HHB10207 ss-3 TaxID=1314776 RepID=A0A166E9Y3_9AGAM|nr:hypothetical protein SISSUDRAFT_644991 [Sistotremastrum suecicum HHB10207 ss-3]
MVPTSSPPETSRPRSICFRIARTISTTIIEVFQLLRPERGQAFEPSPRYTVYLCEPSGSITSVQGNNIVEIALSQIAIKIIGTAEPGILLSRSSTALLSLLHNESKGCGGIQTLQTAIQINTIYPPFLASWLLQGLQDDNHNSRAFRSGERVCPSRSR